MKKKAIVIAVALILLSVNAYAANVSILDMRQTIFDEAKAIKAEMGTTRDVVLISTLWDSCVVTMSQLDAYFSMLGIFNTIKKENLSEDAVNYLIDWLQRIKDMNTSNIKSLGDIAIEVEAKTKLHMQKVADYFLELNKRLDQEVIKLSLIKDSLNPKNTKKK
jgi:hypothetical protein